MTGCIGIDCFGLCQLVQDFWTFDSRMSMEVRNENKVKVTSPTLATYFGQPGWRHLTYYLVTSKDMQDLEYGQQNKRLVKKKGL